MTDVVLFVFAGRKPNLEIQEPYLHRILDENPNVTVHMWNLTTNPTDDEFVRGMGRDRLIVRNDFAGMEPYLGWNHIYKYYSGREYRHTLFIKADDDLTFISTDRISEFISAAQTHSDHIISAQTINNGASTELEPELWAMFETLNIPLLDVHMSAEYADKSHTWFFENWERVVSADTELIDCTSWCSINMISFDHFMMRRIAERVGRRSPAHIGGRDFGPRQKLGDEGLVNMLPILIMKGMVAGHLTFGPQEPSDEQLSRWRAGYAQIAKEYLA